VKKIQTILMAAVAAACLPAQAQTPDALYVRSLAANCSNCHGTNGRVVAASAVPGLAGMPREYMLRQLQAFRDGSRPATVMHQITKGFTPAQLEQIAGYFAAQPK
jgi:cytochrome subunit of sulfide dehydrogenase